MTTYEHHTHACALAALAAPVRCVLAVTGLATGVGASAVAGIFKRSRDLHAHLGVFGAMVFDGERFAVLMCGDHGAVELGLRLLAADVGLTEPSSLADEAQPTALTGSTWVTGWAAPDSLSELACGNGPRGQDAFAWMRSCVGVSDMR